MDQLSTLILIGALAFVVAGAGFAFVQPRRFTDRDADGEPDGLPVLGLDDGALEMFVEWRAELERRLRARDGEPHETALTKFRHHVPALALMTHLVDGGTGLVTAAAMARALIRGESSSWML